MKQVYFIIIGLFISLPTLAQERNIPVTKVIDSLYREDQIYIGLTFHLLRDLPESVSQSGFSGGLHMGFIRDFPLNKRRNIGFGAGLGWSVNSFGQELFIGEDSNNNTIFRNLNSEDIEYDSNRFTTQLIEVPLEFRWRTSTPDSYKFWRVYTGLRLGYVYNFKSTFKQEGNQVVQTDVPEFDRFRIGTTLSFGYNTFNLHLYYSLNPFFTDAKLGDADIGITTFKVGLMFYIL